MTYHEELVEKVMNDTLAHQQKHKEFIRACIREKLDRSTNEQLEACLPVAAGDHVHDWKLPVGIKELAIGIVIVIVLEQALFGWVPSPVSFMMQALIIALICAGLTTCRVCGKSLPILLMAKLRKR